MDYTFRIGNSVQITLRPVWKGVYYKTKEFAPKISLLKRVSSKRKEFAPLGSKFFPFRVDPFYARKQTGSHKSGLPCKIVENLPGTLRIRFFSPVVCLTHLCRADSSILTLDRSISDKRDGWLAFISVTFYRKSCTECKQCRLWSDTVFCGVWSGSTLFANIPFMGRQA